MAWNFDQQKSLPKILAANFLWETEPSKGAGWLYGYKGLLWGHVFHDTNPKYLGVIFFPGKKKSLKKIP